jgi:hypothetical protein
MLGGAGKFNFTLLRSRLFRTSFLWDLESQPYSLLWVFGPFLSYVVELVR